LQLETTRYPWRDRVLFLLSVKAGLRAKEIASLTWGMVTDAERQVSETLHPATHRPLTLPWSRCRHGEEAAHNQPVIVSERGRGLSAAAVQLWFHRLYKSLGLAGCSSHSGRRTFITRAARKVSEAGGSLRDVQQLAGHASLAMTQSYIEGDTAAKRKFIALI
jgi:integrase/recombinase XerC